MILIDGWHLHKFECVSSTMDTARQHLDHKTIIWSLEQTHGRGRLTRSWISQKGNFFCSLVLKPLKHPSQWYELTFLTSVVVKQTLETYLNPSYKPVLKWPNDILILDQKISGVLLEIHQDYIIIGIGINILVQPVNENMIFPPIGFQSVCSNSLRLEELLSSFISQFEQKYDLWIQNGFSFIKDQWQASAYKIHQEICMTSSLKGHPKIIRGYFRGIDMQGCMLLEISPQKILKFYSGDVTYNL